MILYFVKKSPNSNYPHICINTKIKALLAVVQFTQKEVIKFSGSFFIDFTTTLYIGNKSKLVIHIYITQKKSL